MRKALPCRFGDPACVTVSTRAEADRLPAAAGDRIRHAAWPRNTPARHRVSADARSTTLRGAIRSNAPAYVYCYARSAAGEIQRIFPNRFLRDPRVMPGTALVLPGDQGFRIAVDGGGNVTVACMTAPREIYNDVPAALRWGDFQTLNKVKGFEDIKSLLEAIAKEPVEVAQVDLKAQRR